MNHQLVKLDECIFDYLACNADKPISLPEIFTDIRKEVGHRCSDLKSSFNHRQYFLSTCYSLDRQYTNIKKIFWNRKLYLMFQKDRSDTNFEESLYNNQLYEHKYWKDDYTVLNLINYMCDRSTFNDFEDSYFSRIFDGYETLLHLLVTYNKYNELENLLQFHNVDINCRNLKGETPLDVAIAMKNSKMVQLLLKYDKHQKKSDNNRVKTLKEAVNELNNRGGSNSRTNTFENERNRFVATRSQRSPVEFNCDKFIRDYSYVFMIGFFALYIHTYIL